jgi:hypothetical protein
METGVKMPVLIEETIKRFGYDPRIVAKSRRVVAQCPECGGRRETQGENANRRCVKCGHRHTKNALFPNYKKNGVAPRVRGQQQQEELDITVKEEATFLEDGQCQFPKCNTRVKAMNKYCPVHEQLIWQFKKARQ